MATRDDRPVGGPGDERRRGVRSEPAERADAIAEDVRHHAQQMRQIAAEVAAVEDGVAETFRTAAAVAARKGRAEDAERLTRYAERAGRYAAQQRDHAARPPAGDRDR